MSEIPELTAEDFNTAIPASLRRRLSEGMVESGEDVGALRRFVGLSQVRFAKALGISVHTLRNWEQGRRQPEGPGLALLRIAARHPRIIHENLAFSNTVSPAHAGIVPKKSPEPPDIPRARGDRPGTTSRR